MKDNKELKTCDVFSQKLNNFESVRNSYIHELSKAGGDYRNVQKIQEKYASYFDAAGSNILKGYKEKETDPDECAVWFDRVSLNAENKKLLQCTETEKLVKAGLCERISSPVVCVCCGKPVHGLGLTVETDNSFICLDCCDADNYFDFNEIKLFVRE